MALELMPDGKTFKKLNATQEKALKRYYKRTRDKPWQETLGLPILAGGVVIAGTIGAIAYVFREEAKTAFIDEKEKFFTWLTGLPKKAVLWTGGGVADTVVSLVDLVGLSTNEPVTPEFIIINGREIGPLSTCKRWEVDATTWLENVQAGKFITKIGAALAGNYIIKNMKEEGCPKPLAFTQAQWDAI